jgi:site-specific DNA-methyltransferase (adenine-specific)
MIKAATAKLSPYRVFESAVRGAIYNADALDFLKTIRSSSASVVFLDPPFNLGTEYIPGDKRSDRQNPEAYRNFLEQVADEAVRILAPGGALYLYHLPIWALRLGSRFDQELSFRHWIAVSMKNGFARGRRLYPAHYGLLYFTKGEPKRFNRPKVDPEVCRSCKKTVRDYGGYRSIIEEKGLNLSDVWADLSPVRHGRYKTRSANELPMALTRRIVEISGYAKGLFVDPFAGSGAAVAAAVERKMRFLACDIVSENCELISARVASSHTHASNGRKK